MTKLFTYAFLLQCLSMSFLFAWNGNAQVKDIEEVMIRVSLDNTDVEQAFSRIEDLSGYSFVYTQEDVRGLPRVSATKNRQSIYRLLSEISQQTGLQFRQVNQNIHVRRPADVGLSENSVSIEVETIDITVTGTVTDANGEPLPGVTVSVPGTTVGTATDLDGRYSLTVPEGSTLVFSFIGFESQSIAVGDRNVIDVVLGEDMQGLEEVVVVGYAIQRKKDVTGAVSVVDVDEMVQQPSGQVANLLQGRASGVTILGGGQPGENPQIRIRGINTFGNNTPLFVVDGVPTGNINDLNPNDISSIQVLKDASASIYGSRAANGVIIITTKTGDGKTKVQYDAYYGIQTVKQGNVWDLNSPQEMAELKWLVYKNTNPGQPINDPLYGNGERPVLPDYIAPAGLFEGDPRVDPSLYNVNPFYTDPADLQTFYRINRANKEGTDWFHEIFSAAPTMNHNLAISGGNENSKYLFSMNYLDQQGTLMNTYLKRYTIRANSEFNINNRVRIGENVAISLMDNPRVTTLSEGSAIAMARRQQPIIPVYDIMGNYAGGSGGILGVSQNPVAMLDRTKNNKSIGKRIFGNVFAEVDLIDPLMFRTSFGGEISSSNSRSFSFPTYENAENTPTNSYSESANNSYNWTWTNTLQYKKSFNDSHDLTLILGTESYKNSGGSLGGTTYDYYSFDENFTNLSTGSGTQTNYSSRYMDALFSYIGRLDYGFNDKYLLGLTIRRDGSSRFLNKQYGWFPAVSAAWRISEEGFFQNAAIEWIDDLKIRGGYGIMGNQLNVDAANSFTVYGSSRTHSSYDITGSGNSLEEGFKKTRVGNPDASWEKNINSNFGFDATLFLGKLNLTFDYYRKDIEDLLYNPDLLGTAGRATRPFVNVAAMKNTGIDFSAASFFNVAQDLKFDVTLHFTTFDNKIINISNSANYFDIDSRRFNGSTIVRNAVGHSVGQFYGYQIVGFWNSQDEIDEANESVRNAGEPDAVYQNDMKVGRFRYFDANGDGKITPDDRIFLGNPNPDFSYGINLGLTYKKFDFGMFLYGVAGNEIWNNVLWWTDFNSSFEAAKSRTALYNSWTPENQNAKAPIQEVGASFSSANVPNSYFVENGSYLRAKNTQLGYTFSPSQLERLKISSFRVYLQAANLFTITKYSGLDPEVSGGTVNFGIDEGTYPNQKQFLIGVNLTF